MLARSTIRKVRRSFPGTIRRRRKLPYRVCSCRLIDDVRHRLDMLIVELKRAAERSPWDYVEGSGRDYCDVDDYLSCGVGEHVDFVFEAWCGAGGLRGCCTGKRGIPESVRLSLIARPVP